jgi:hypothetical protein
MSLLYLPVQLSAFFIALAIGLDRRIAQRFPSLLLGVLFARGRRTVTSWFRAAGITTAFKQGYQDVAAAGRNHHHSAVAVLLATQRLLQPEDDLVVALDDTPTPRWGPCVEGAGIHHNPTPGPAGEKYVYGHVWVTLAALLHHPEQGPRALPLLAEMYVRRKDITAILRCQGVAFATKLEQAGQQLLWLFDAAERARRIIVVADGAYAKRPLLLVIRRLHMTLVSRLPSNAALWTLPPRRRRPGQRGPLPTYGKQRIDLARRAANPRGWQQVSCLQYREIEVKQIKTFLTTWRPAGGVIRVVLVQEEDGWRAYFSTDPDMSPVRILELAADRGALEETFKDLKEIWGAGQQQLRNYWANVGAFNMNVWMCSAVELWGWQGSHEELVDRSASPWDKTERRPSHADKRGTLRRAMLRAEILAVLAAGPDEESFSRLAEQLLSMAV